MARSPTSALFRLPSEHCYLQFVYVSIILDSVVDLFIATLPLTQDLTVLSLCARVWCICVCLTCSARRLWPSALPGSVALRGARTRSRASWHRPWRRRASRCSMPRTGGGRAGRWVGGAREFFFFFFFFFFFLFLFPLSSRRYLAQINRFTTLSRNPAHDTADKKKNNNNQTRDLHCRPTKQRTPRSSALMPASLRWIPTLLVPLARIPLPPVPPTPRRCCGRARGPGAPSVRPWRRRARTRSCALGRPCSARRTPRAPPRPRSPRSSSRGRTSPSRAPFAALLQRTQRAQSRAWGRPHQIYLIDFFFFF
jgi:hypothetical protein